MAKASNGNGATLSSFSYNYSNPGYTNPNGSHDTLLPFTYSETLTSPGGTVANVNGKQSYDQLNRLTYWLVTKQSDGSVAHSYSYVFDGVGNRTQVVADPAAPGGGIAIDPAHGLANSNESDLLFKPANEIDHINAYGSYGSTGGHTYSISPYYYDPAGEQAGNDTAGSSTQGLRIGYTGSDQVASITNDKLGPDGKPEPVAMTFAGSGEAERVPRRWTDQGTNYTSSYTFSLLGLSGRATNAPGTPASSVYVRDPSGRLIAERNSDGTDYYYLFDGAGDVAALEDPGTVVAAYDYCPTGNDADLASPPAPLGPGPDLPARLPLAAAGAPQVCLLVGPKGNGEALRPGRLRRPRGGGGSDGGMTG